MPSKTLPPRQFLEMPVAKYNAVLAAMKSVPQATHAEFPQYAGHWDDWVLVCVLTPWSKHITGCPAREAVQA